MIYLLFLLISLTPYHSLHGMKGKAEEPRNKKHKAVTAVVAAETAPVSECDMLLDAYKQGTKSIYYKPSQIPFNIEDDHGSSTLERALHRHDLQECINLVAEGWQVDKPLPNRWYPIHAAAQANMLSFCQFLLDLHINPNLLIMGQNLTALDIASMRGYGQVSKLLLNKGAFAVNTRIDQTWMTFNYLTRCQDLTAQELQECTTILAAQQAQFHITIPHDAMPERSIAIFRHRVEEDQVFDTLALQSTPKRFHELFPLLMQLGADLETHGDDGRAPLARLAYFWQSNSGDILNAEFCTKALINIVTAYHAYLERAQVKSAETAIVIRNHRKDSLLAKLPRDVLKTCVLKYLVPFRTKHVTQCVNEQLALMQRLLAIKKAFADTQSVAEIQDSHVDPMQQKILVLFDPANVAQHREQLIKVNCEVMGLPQQDIM